MPGKESQKSNAPGMGRGNECIETLGHQCYGRVRVGMQMRQDVGENFCRKKEDFSLQATLASIPGALLTIWKVFKLRAVMLRPSTFDHLEPHSLLDSWGCKSIFIVGNALTGSRMIVSRTRSNA